MEKSRKLIFSIVGLGIVIIAGLAFFRFKDKIFTAPLPQAVPYDSVSTSQNDAVPEIQNVASTPTSALEPEEKVDLVLPAEVNLKIPFTSQAPHQNWDEPYQNFCEEASALMAASFVKNQTISGPNDADAKMLAIKDFEMKKFGYYLDTTAEETAVILREYFGLSKVEVISNPSVEEIKTALVGGRAVIVPLAGREIGNPNFQQPGPLYHMLVIKGYTKNGEFITNDPGTRKGADYVYKEGVIMNAIHDWNGGDVNAGKKVIIIVG